MQHVRRAAARDRTALLDAEPVLLVDHGDGEVVQLDAFLDQRVRADDDLRAGHVVLDRAGQQGDAHAELATGLLEREEVLLGQGLGRRHQRTPLAGFDRAQQRVQRDDGLPRADLSLQQPLHRLRLREVGVDLRDRALLVLGELERQPLPVARDQVAGLAESGRTLFLAAQPPPGEPDLQDEQLVEREPAAPPLAVLLVAWSMEGVERIGSTRKPGVLRDPSGQEVRPVTHVRQRLADQLAQLLDRHVLARRVDRSEVGRGRGPVQVVRADGELVSLELAAQAHARPGLQLLGQPDLVEPDGRDLAALVGDPRLHDREPP